MSLTVEAPLSSCGFHSVLRCFESRAGRASRAYRPRWPMPKEQPSAVKCQDGKRVVLTKEIAFAPSTKLPPPTVMMESAPVALIFSMISRTSE